MVIKKILRLQNYLLIMIKRLLILPLLLISISSYGQISLASWGNGYMSVNSFSGSYSNGAFVLQINYNGNNLNISNWKLSATLEDPILSEDGTREFPADKLNLIISNIQGQSSNTIPSISDIGFINPAPLSNVTETFIVPNANYPLINISENTSYYSLYLYFNLQVVGGSYLSDLQGGYTQKSYPMKLKFTIYNELNEVIGVAVDPYKIDVFKLIDNPITDVLSLGIATEAKEGEIKFQNFTDYLTGVNVVYNNAVNVNSSVDYQITVKSLSPYFSSSNGNILPLDVVKVKLHPNNNDGSAIYTQAVSVNKQILFSGSKTEDLNNLFDLEYFTESDDNRLLNLSDESYSTVLQFEVSPR